MMKTAITDNTMIDFFLLTGLTSIIININSINLDKLIVNKKSADLSRFSSLVKALKT